MCPALYVLPVTTATQASRVLIVSVGLELEVEVLELLEVEEVEEVLAEV
jgi:hypothetical protein